MKKYLFVIVGGILMGIGLAGATMDIPTTWHYFGNGAVFGIGISMLISGLFTNKKKPKKEKEPNK